MLICSQNKVSLKCCCCKMYRLPPPPCKGIRISVCRIRIQGKPFLCLQNPTNDWNPENKFHRQKRCTVHGSGIQVVKFRIQQCLDSLRWGKGIVPVPHTEKQTLQRGNRRKKPTDLTNGSLNAQKFLQLNPFLI